MIVMTARKPRNTNFRFRSSQLARGKSARTVVFRTTKKGERVVRGPSTLVRVGPVRVREWGQDVTVEVTHVGRPFDVQGTEVVYGYLAENPRSTPS